MPIAHRRRNASASFIISKVLPIRTPITYCTSRQVRFRYLVKEVKIRLIVSSWFSLGCLKQKGRRTPLLIGCKQSQLLAALGRSETAKQRGSAGAPDLTCREASPDDRVRRNRSSDKRTTTLAVGRNQHDLIRNGCCDSCRVCDCDDTGRGRDIDGLCRAARRSSCASVRAVTRATQMSAPPACRSVHQPRDHRSPPASHSPRCRPLLPCTTTPGSSLP